MDFKELKVLNLSQNKILDIEILINVDFKKLEYLNLANNRKYNQILVKDLRNKIKNMYPNLLLNVNY